jgi:hypothetical protein
MRPSTPYTTAGRAATTSIEEISTFPDSVGRDRDEPETPDPVEPLGPVEFPEPDVVDVPEPGVVEVPEPPL